MSASSIEAQVREIIAEQLGLSDDDISLESSFSEDLGTDALDFMELVMAFEEEFEVEINDEDAEGLKTVGDAVDYLTSRV